VLNQEARLRRGVDFGEGQVEVRVRVEDGIGFESEVSEG